MRARAAMLACIRAYFADQQVLEVDTPALGSSTATDPFLASFEVSMLGTSYYLQTSPEFAMKRLLAEGIGDIYQLGKAFRVDEQGNHHNPEFTLLEWYRLGWRWPQLQGEVLRLIKTVAHSLVSAQVVPGAQAWPDNGVYTYRQVFLEQLGIDPFSASSAQLQSVAEQHVQGAMPSLDRDGWLDLLMAQVIEPRLPQGIVTVTEFPASQAALAKVAKDADGNLVAQRFEVYINGVELANGYQELTDASEQRARFVADNQHREALGLPILPIPEALLAALEKGLPACAGVALGVDRLLMAVLSLDTLAETQPFAFARV